MVSNIQLFHNLTLVAVDVTFCNSRIKSEMVQSNYETSPILTPHLEYEQYREKSMEQSKEIDQNGTGPKDFDICLCVTFACYDQSFICGRETGH